MTKEELKLKRNFSKQLKATRKKLIKIAKEWNPWDYTYAIDLFIASIEGMKWYYEQTYNVWAEDDNANGDDISRAEKCNRILKAFDSYMGSGDWQVQLKRWDEFWNLVKEYLLYLWD